MTAIIVTVDDAQDVPIDRGRERLGFLIWALLFFNGLAFTSIPLLIPIPGAVGKMATQGALALAAVLVLIFNRKHLVHPNLYLTLFSILAVSSLMVSVRMATGLGMLVRSGRFCIFVALLWLLTPLWGRRDRILLRWHTTCLIIALSTVVVGGLLAPGKARAMDGRLAGAVWPMTPTQVGHLAAVLAGITFVLLISGSIRTRRALLIGSASVVILLLSHTRTALVGLVVGLVCATISLLTIRGRARWTAIGAIVVVTIAATLFAPAISKWFARGEAAQQVSGFNGRKEVWDQLVSAPRSRFTEIFGKGQTNDSFNGLAIDNSWYAIYQNDGLFGIAICAFVLVSLLMLAAIRPRGPSVAVAVFLIIYCSISSLTEVGLGAASPYLLELTVAAALLAPPGDRAVATRSVLDA